MRASGILIMTGGLVLGVVLTIYLTAPKGDLTDASLLDADRSSVPSLTPANPDARGPGDVRGANRPAVAPEQAEPETAPQDGQQTELSNGLKVHWARGRNQVSAWRQDQCVWSQELPFAVADVVREAAPDELRIASVDAMSTLVLDGGTGTVRHIAQREAPAGGDRVAGLLAQVKTEHADALARLQAGDQRGALAACERMGALARELSDANRQNEAFRIWAAATKLRRAIAPEVAGRELPKEEQPRPEDLEF